MHGLEFTTGPILILIGLVLYFLPAVNAYCRGHHNAGPILIINVFFGWTLLGWVVALAWSCSALAATNAPAAWAAPYSVQKYDRY